jgi:hypothetical protein
MKTFRLANNQANFRSPYVLNVVLECLQLHHCSICERKKTCTIKVKESGRRKRKCRKRHNIISEKIETELIYIFKMLIFIGFRFL